MEKTELNLMPVSYKGFARSFKNHPVTNDLIINTEELNVRDAIINLFFTARYERPYNEIGLGIEQYLFEQMGIDVAISIQDKIQAFLSLWEPRCIINSVTVKPNFDENSYDITIQFSVLNTPSRIFTINLPLKRLR